MNDYIERDVHAVANRPRDQQQRVSDSIALLTDQDNLPKHTAFTHYQQYVGLFAPGSLSEFPELVNEYKHQWKQQTGINFPITSWFLFQMREHGKTLLYTAAVLSAAVGFGLFFTATAPLSVPATLLLGVLATALSMSSVGLGIKAKEYTAPLQFC